MLKYFRFAGLPKLTVGRKLGLGFGVVVVLLIVGAVFAVVSLNRASDMTSQMAWNAELGESLDEFELNIYKARAGLIDYTIFRMEPAKEEIEEAQGKAGEEYEAIVAHTSPETAELIQAAGEIHDTLNIKVDEILTTYEAKPDDHESIHHAFMNLDDYTDETMKPVFLELNALVDESSKEHAMHVASQVNAMTVTAAALSVGATILAIGIGFYIARSILKQVNAIGYVYNEIGMGNFEARAEVTSGDELGTMANSLNAMLDNTLALIQTREERDAMESSVQKLLGEVSGVAEGDLTMEAEVTADITGAIADSFNLMIGQLRNIITGVQDATIQVSSSANEIQITTEHLSQGSESQAMQISDASTAIEEMAVSIAQVSENATMSATVGEQSLADAQKGTLAVQNTVDGMNRIRDQVQETAKRIKRLGESSQEIGEIVQLIGDIADRTSILALNASIQAAMAGDAGQGFAVVAEEVERLAERSTEATKQIDTLIRTIQNETNEAVAAMEATTTEVVEGSLLAGEAGQALSEIGAVSQRLAELNQSISLASKQQARGSETLAKSMADIADVTQQTAAGTKQAAVSISTLATLADELRDSVSAFKLPSGNGRESV